MEMDRLKTLVEKLRVTAPNDKMRTMADVVEELAHIANDLDRRLKAIEGQGGGASGAGAGRHSSDEIAETQPEDGTLQKPHKPENEFDEESPKLTFNDESSNDDREGFDSRTRGQF